MSRFVFLMIPSQSTHQNALVARKVPMERNIDKVVTPRCTFPAKKISEIQTQKAVGLVMVTAVAGIMKTPL